MNWLVVAIISYLFFAITSVIDKVILSKTPIRPAVGSFYVGISSIFALLLVPFGFYILPINDIVFCFLSGSLFIVGVYLLYRSIWKLEVSMVVPAVGGIVPIFSLVLSYVILGERLNLFQIIAFLFLLLGIFLICDWRSLLSGLKHIVILGSAFSFSLAFVLSKLVFARHDFLPVFIWIRLGAVLAALIFLIWPGNLSSVLKTTKEKNYGAIGLFFGNKIFSALATVLQNYAIYLGSVTLVGAMQGVQYALLFIIAFVLSKKIPVLFEEKIGKKVIFRKLAAILLIGVGLGILSLYA